MTSVEYLGAYRLTQSDDYFKLGRDSVLLARFATLRKGWSVCDLGCGVGSLLLLLSQREGELDRVGIELNPGAAALARQNLADNGLAGEILDRWGREVTLVPVRDGFTVTAPAVLGPAFWGWLAAQGEKVTLLSPTWAVRVWEENYRPRVGFRFISSEQRQAVF